MLDAAVVLVVGGTFSGILFAPLTVTNNELYSTNNGHGHQLCVYSNKNIILRFFFSSRAFA